LVRRLNVDGDAQGHLAGHGGEHRAVFAYQMDFLPLQRELKRHDFTFWQFSLRGVLGLPILSAVADRSGLWEPPGATSVSWGDWSHFVAYTAKVNSFLPEAVVPALAVIATVAELLLGVALILGVFSRQIALATATLLTFFAIAMTLSFGISSTENSWFLRTDSLKSMG
jgi:hypothetical protein